MEKMTNVLALAAEILNTYEGYADYDAMQDGLSKIYDIIENAASTVLPAAKNSPWITRTCPSCVMSSGATTKVAYSFSSFLMMEMRWVNSSSFSDGEFFHGPLRWWTRTCTTCF